MLKSLIYPYMFLGLSNSSSLLIPQPSPPEQATAQHTAPSPLGGNIRCDKKGGSQSFLQINLLHDLFKFPVQAPV